MNEAAQILAAIEQGDRQAAEQLLPLVYDELRRLAARKLAHESPGHSLQATALVHEAYLRLVATAPGHRWDSHGHFFAAAARAMRHILVEAARRKSAENGVAAGGGPAWSTCLPRPGRRNSSPSTTALDRLATRRPSRRQGGRTPPVRRPGARANRGHSRHHGVSRSPEMDVRSRVVG